MALDRYTAFDLTPIDGSKDALRLNIHHPPINALRDELLTDFHQLLKTLATDSDSPKVIVVSSDNPDYWISHLDLRIASSTHPLPKEDNAEEKMHALGASIHLLGTVSTIFLAEINGRAISGGNEFALNMDMRFAGPNATFGIVEVGGGLIHVGAIQQLTRLVGAGRAAEYMLTAKAIDAEEADRIGWVNKSFTTAAALRTYVEELALRIALFPRDAIKYTKMGIRENLAGTGSIQTDLGRFKELLGRVESQYAITQILERSNDMDDGSFERGLPDNIIDIWKHKQGS